MVGIDQDLPVDSVGCKKEVIIAGNEELRIGPFSEHIHEANIIDLIIITIEFECVLGEDKILIEIKLSYIVDSSFLANDVQGRFVLVHPPA